MKQKGTKETKKMEVNKSLLCFLRLLLFPFIMRNREKYANRGINPRPSCQIREDPRPILPSRPAAYSFAWDDDLAVLFFVWRVDHLAVDAAVGALGVHPDSLGAAGVASGEGADFVPDAEIVGEDRGDIAADFAAESRG